MARGPFVICNVDLEPDPKRAAGIVFAGGGQQKRREIENGWPAVELGQGSL